MIQLFIGISLGLLIIGSLKLLKQLDKQLMYGLILSAIGFLYVGFTWTDLFTFCICCLQALVFLFLAYFGGKKSMLLLAAGYCLHGLWDMGFDQVFSAELIPPHYDLFCMAVDLTIGMHLFILYYKTKNQL